MRLALCKRRWLSRKDAESIAAKTGKIAYECEHCHAWHVRVRNYVSDLDRVLG